MIVGWPGPEGLGLVVVVAVVVVGGSPVEHVSTSWLLHKMNMDRKVDGFGGLRVTVVASCLGGGGVYKNELFLLWV